MLTQAAATLDKGFLLALYWVASRCGPTRRWVLVSRYVACSLWAQLRPAEHETGVFPGVLPRLRVAFVFPTRALGHEGLALRCNGNKSPNHLIPSRSQGQGIPSFPSRRRPAHHEVLPLSS